jgi:dTDP-4-dehydrorhamnose 3,5-epimerase
MTSELLLTELPLSGAYIIQFAKHEDSRGYFSRCFCEKSIQNSGIDATIKQTSLSYNERKHTLRGMHFQLAPYEEAKFVSCISGSIFDVIIDLRKHSDTYLKWHGEVLSESNNKTLFVPKGFAHGFITLVDQVKVLYHIDNYYHPEASAGYRWDDPAFNIDWPNRENLIISEKDKSYSNYSI